MSSKMKHGVRIARRSINNLRYADGTTLMAESEEELKSLLMEVKEESEKAGLKSSVQKTKIRTLSNTIHKNKLKMDKRSKCKTRNYKTPRGEHRENTLRHKSQQDPL